MVLDLLVLKFVTAVLPLLTFTFNYSTFILFIGCFLQMLSSKDLNFVGYTYKNFEIVNDYQVPGMGTSLSLSFIPRMLFIILCLLQCSIFKHICLLLLEVYLYLPDTEYNIIIERTYSIVIRFNFLIFISCFFLKRHEK